VNGRIFILLMAALVPATAVFADTGQAGEATPQAAEPAAAGELPPEFVLPEPELPGGVLNYSEADVPEAPSGWAVLGRLFGSLAIVLGLIVLTALLLKRMLVNSKHTPGGKLVEVIQTFPLGPKRQIYLVKVAGRVLVVGGSGDNLSLLTDLPENEVVAGAQTVEAALEQSAGAVREPPLPLSTKRSEFFDLLKTVGRQFVAGRVS